MSARHVVTESAREALGDLYAADATGDLPHTAEPGAELLLTRGHVPATAVRVAFQAEAPFTVNAGVAWKAPRAPGVCPRGHVGAPRWKDGGCVDCHRERQRAYMRRRRTARRAA